MKKYKVEEHTADISISASGKTIEELLVNTAEGLLSEFVDIASFKKSDYKSDLCEDKFLIEFIDYENCLIQFLNKIIYLVEVEDKVPVKFNLSFLSKKLEVNCFYLYIGEKDNVKKRNIKAATYYDVKIVKDKVDYKVKVVFDV
ncbi:MAG: archease [Armatimonadota bacterium]